MQQYRYRDGFRTLSALKPAMVADELERIKEANGVLTSDGVLEAARPEGALLHNEFEWDGEAAVRKLGMLRASAIIRAVVIIPDEPKTHPHRIWIGVSSDDPTNRSSHYEKLEVVVRQVDLYEQALVNLQRRFDSAAAALDELRAAASGTPDPNRQAVIGLAADAFSTLRQALTVLGRDRDTPVAVAAGGTAGGGRA